MDGPGPTLLESKLNLLEPYLRDSSFMATVVCGGGFVVIALLLYMMPDHEEEATTKNATAVKQPEQSRITSGNGEVAPQAERTADDASPLDRLLMPKRAIFIPVTVGLLAVIGAVLPSNDELMWLVPYLRDGDFMMTAACGGGVAVIALLLYYLPAE